MPKSKKIKRSKKSVSAAPSRQMPLAQNYEDLTSSDESAIADKNSRLTPTTNVVVDRIFSGDPEMADEGGKRVSRSENGQHIEKMSVNSALGPPVMIENKSGGDNEPNCEESEGSHYNVSIHTNLDQMSMFQQLLMMLG
ncbi:hypothetical protein niasHT_023348 [Heterodera trifolii]|uniref:Uncharacterized protein n=1 Tax=Heterodera trifolii TaxID=157864 RepID=A0ABD2JYK2_9BILA